MTTRVRLTADVDPELRRRVKIAAIESEQTVSQWIEQVLRDRLRDPEATDTDDAGRHSIAPGISMPRSSEPPRGSSALSRLRGPGATISEAVIEDRR